MAYNKKALYNQAMEAIAENKLFFIEDVVAFLPCSKETFYKKFPLKSDEMDAIKKALEDNRIVMKSSMRSKWYNSENPSLQIALMKIISTPAEYERLSGKVQETPNTERMKPPVINFVSKPKPKRAEPKKKKE